MYKPISERHEDEKLTNNEALNHYSQCKNCAFRYKNYFVSDGKKYNCDDSYGWKKAHCHIFEEPQSKPNEVYNNSDMCEFYEKG